MNTYTVEFRIEGVDLIPLEITKLLKLSPSQTRIYTKEINKNSLWSYDGVSFEKDDFIESEWNTLEEGLLFILDHLLPKKRIIKSKLNMYKRYLWCGSFQESFDATIRFSPELLQKLSLFDTEVIVTNYSST